MPAVVNDRCPMVQTVQNTVELYGPHHRDFTVAVQLKYGRCPCCVRRAGSTVLSWLRQPRSHSRRSSSIPHFMAVAVRMWLFARLRAFFALRPLGRRVPGGGDAGSLLPGVLPPELDASHARAWTDTP